MGSARPTVDQSQLANGLEATEAAGAVTDNIATTYDASGHLDGAVDDDGNTFYIIIMTLIIIIIVTLCLTMFGLLYFCKKSVKSKGTKPKQSGMTMLKSFES